MLHQRLARLASSRHHVHHARRDSRFLGEARELERGGRRDLRGLEHDRVPRGERGRDAHDREEGGRVPRHDDADHAQGLAQRVVEHARALERNHPALDLVGESPEVIEPVLDRLRLGAHLRQQLAVLLRLDGGDLLGVLGDPVSPRHEQPAPARGRELRPGPMESRHRRLDGAIDVRAARFREPSPDLSGGGVHRGETAPVGRRDALPRDVVVERAVAGRGSVHGVFSGKGAARCARLNSTPE